MSFIAEIQGKSLFHTFEDFFSPWKNAGAGFLEVEEARKGLAG